MFVRYEFPICYTFLLDIQCTTFYIENSVKRTNSHLPFAPNSPLPT